MNKVMLIGNVGQDPEVRYVEQGVAVARLRLATTERGYTLQNGTQVPDHTDWHNVILWRKLAEVVEKYVHKGDKLYIDFNRVIKKREKKLRFLKLKCR
jgi:single-strand DNA-binding protein